jgi:uncharacterized protein
MTSTGRIFSKLSELRLRVIGIDARMPLAAMRLRFEAWRTLRDLDRVEHGLLLPILLYCVDPLGQPMLGPPRDGTETEAFIRSAYHDIPLVIPQIRTFWMPERLREAKGQA